MGLFSQPLRVNLVLSTSSPNYHCHSLQVSMMNVLVQCCSVGKYIQQCPLGPYCLIVLLVLIVTLALLLHCVVHALAKHIC